MRLVYNPAKNPMGQAQSFCMAKVTVRAGENNLNDKQMGALKTHPDYQKFIDLKAFLVEGEPVEVVEVTKTTSRKKTPILLDMPEK